MHALCTPTLPAGDRKKHTRSRFSLGIPTSIKSFDFFHAKFSDSICLCRAARHTMFASSSTSCLVLYLVSLRMNVNIVFCQKRSNTCFWWNFGIERLSLFTADNICHFHWSATSRLQVAVIAGCCGGKNPFPNSWENCWQIRLSTLFVCFTLIDIAFSLNLCKQCTGF